MALITFKCRLVSPLHTAAERYSNVQTCAPWILGSTLRGAMLSQIIRRRCSPEHFGKLMADNPGYHAKCPGPCGAKPLFDVKQTRFSFGRFPGDRPPRAFRSRVAIDRERWSVAEGALLQFEVIPPVNADGSPVRFSFELEVADEQLARLVCEAAAWGGVGGIGAFRNQGFGRFAVEKTETKTELPVNGPLAPGKHLFLADTPYVVPSGQALGQACLERDLDALFAKGWSDLYLRTISVQAANLGYVGRWCYESSEGSKRHTRLAALPGSALCVEIAQEIPAADAARLLRGMGEWAEVGFGRWAVLDQPEDDTTQ